MHCSQTFRFCEKLNDCIETGTITKFSNMKKKKKQQPPDYIKKMGTATM